MDVCQPKIFSALEIISFSEEGPLCYVALFATLSGPAVRVIHGRKSC